MTPTDTQRTRELLPCPFCGGEANIVENGVNGGKMFYAACCSIQCFCAVGEGYDGNGYPDHSFITRSLAAKAWNQRAALQPQPLDKCYLALKLILKTHDLTCKPEECQISGIDLGRLAIAEYEAIKPQPLDEVRHKEVWDLIDYARRGGKVHPHEWEQAQHYLEQATQPPSSSAKEGE